MLTFYTALKHLSGLALIFFTMTLIIVITDLENIPNVPLQTWFIKISLIIASLVINRTCNKRIAELE